MSLVWRDSPSLLRQLPFDRSLEDKLAKAKEDAQLALVESEKCKAEFAQLQLQQTEAENILNTLTTELNEAKGEILYIASELNIVGLREKKPIIGRLYSSKNKLL